MGHMCALLAATSLSLLPLHAVPNDLLKPQEKSAIYVEPVTLTEVQERIGFRLNIGAVVSNSDMAKGLQKAADVYGLKLDVFVERDPAKRRELARMLVENKETYLIVDNVPGDTLSDVVKVAGNETRVREISKLASDTQSPHDRGFSAVREARSAILDRIPKYDEILPLAFPISPLPDNFFQPSKFPYPAPLVRAARTNESVSASVHAHTSCNMVAQTGNMLHRTSSVEPGRLLMGMEGGNLSLQALPGALDKPKISAVMTSWVLNLDDGGRKREILVENNGLESSNFKPGIHAPEELEIALVEWRRRGSISGFRILDHEHVRIEGWEGRNVTLRAGLFLVANDRHADGPVLVPGRDRYGARTIDFFSTQEFVQQLVEVLEHPVPNGKAEGGLLTAGGATTGNAFGRPLDELLRAVPHSSAPVQPYVMSLEGGYLVVTPETALTDRELKTPIKRIYLDLRGPLTSDQTIIITLTDGRPLTFRRTVIDFTQLDDALNALRSMGMISGWEYEGSRGRGLFANVVLFNYLGKHRKFMSSLSTWPTDEKPTRPLVRFYVDGMQRLNFGLLTSDGWRQEFVEVPLRIPPVPRDISLYSGKSSLD